MMRKTMLGFGLVGLSLAVAAAPARAQKADVPGPIDSLSDLQDSGKMLFKLADENNDGQISQQEAINAGNGVIGGFFFRADLNGDGSLSADEAKQARDAFLTAHPMVKTFLESAKATPGQPAAAGAAGTPNPIQAVGNLLDSNNDKQIQATEVRQAVQTAVQAFYASADTNRDNQLSPTEVNAAMVGVANAAAQAAFQAADTDKNGQLSQAEYSAAIQQPALAIFRAIDLNNDNQLSPQEAQQARTMIMSQVKALRVPEPANSARNLLRSGANPAQVAPVPTFGAPAQAGQPAPAPAPAPAAAPATPPQN